MSYNSEYAHSNPELHAVLWRLTAAKDSYRRLATDACFVYAATAILATVCSLAVGAVVWTVAYLFTQHSAAEAAAVWVRYSLLPLVGLALGYATYWTIRAWRVCRHDLTQAQFQLDRYNQREGTDHGHT